MWSFCLSRIFLLISVSPCPGRDFISFQTRKETKQRNAFQTAYLSVVVAPFQVFGPNVAPPPRINPQLTTNLSRERRAHASPLRPYSNIIRVFVSQLVLRAHLSHGK